MQKPKRKLERHELEAGLRQFDGTNDYHTAGLPPILVTDGVKWLADNAEAWWLVDVIASHQINPAVRAEPFQVWTLKVKDEEGRVEATDGDKGSGPVVLAVQTIDYTDFPLPEIKLYFEGGVLMLPGER